MHKGPKSLIAVKTGYRCGILTVVSVPDNPKSSTWAIVKCDCGVEKRQRVCQLRRGLPKSCGCAWRETIRATRTTNLLGKKFGRLLVVERSSESNCQGGGALWLAVCDCGNKLKVYAGRLISGKTQSCGCLKRERQHRDCQPGDATRRALLRSYKWGAKTRELEWKLSDSEFYDLISMPCHYCNGAPALRDVGGHGALAVNGVDRKDNLLGYSTSNVLPCCKFCQFAKRDLSYDDFINNLKRVAEYKVWKISK
jgi:hypothetical protein